MADEETKIIQENQIAIIKSALGKLSEGDKIQINCINNMEVKINTTEKSELIPSLNNLAELIESLEPPRLPRLLNLCCMAIRNKHRTPEKAVDLLGIPKRTYYRILESGTGFEMNRSIFVGKGEDGEK